MSDFSLILAENIEEETALSLALSPPVNRAFLDKTIDWPSPAATESSRALAVWYPTFDREFSLSPTISSQPTPRPIPAGIDTIISHGGLPVSSNANIANEPKKPDRLQSIFYPVQTQIQSPVYSMLNSWSLMEEALYLIREDVNQYAGVIENEFTFTLLESISISHDLHTFDLLMKHNRPAEATEFYNSASATVLAATTNSGSIMLVSRILSTNCAVGGELFWTYICKILSQQTDFTSRQRTSLSVIALLLLQHPHDSRELSIRFLQCLIDHLSIHLSHLSAPVVLLKCYFYFFADLNDRFQAMEIFSRIRNHLDHFAKQWNSAHRIAFLWIAYLLVNEQEFSMAEQCYRLGLPAAFDVSLVQRHLLFPFSYDAVRCYASQHHYFDALNLVDRTMHDLQWAPPFRRAMKSGRLGKLRSRISDAMRQEALGIAITVPYGDWWY